MLQEHNTVVKTYGFCLTRMTRFTSLRIVKAGELVSRWLLAVGVGLTVGACAVVDSVPDEDAAKVVSERVRQRWDLVLKGRVEDAYGYLSPASRAAVSLEAFRKRSSGRWWRKLDIDKVDCRQDTCQVRMTAEYDLYEIKGLKRSIDETWIKDAGIWWYVAGK